MKDSKADVRDHVDKDSKRRVLQLHESIACRRGAKQVQYLLGRNVLGIGACTHEEVELLSD
jgi:hypothetical protein